MNADTRDQVTFTLATITTLCVFITFAVRMVLLPWLREHLVVPVAETNRQVSENTHSSDPPTLLDEMHQVRNEVKALANVMDQHLSWSDRWSNLIEREVEQMRREEGNGA